MSIRGNTRPQPRAWSRKAKDLIAGHGRKAAATALEISEGLLSALHCGSRITSAAVVAKGVAGAASYDVALTPADLGRPDLRGPR